MRIMGSSHRLHHRPPSVPQPSPLSFRPCRDRRMVISGLALFPRRHRSWAVFSTPSLYHLLRPLLPPLAARSIRKSSDHYLDGQDSPTRRPSPFLWRYLLDRGRGLAYRGTCDRGAGWRPASSSTAPARGQLCSGVGALADNAERFHFAKGRGAAALA